MLAYRALLDDGDERSRRHEDALPDDGGRHDARSVLLRSSGIGVALRLVALVTIDAAPTGVDRIAEVARVKAARRGDVGVQQGARSRAQITGRLEVGSIEQDSVDATKLAKHLHLVLLLYRHAHRLVFFLGQGRELIGLENEVGIHLLGLDVAENLDRSFDAKRDSSRMDLSYKFRSRLCG